MHEQPILVCTRPCDILSPWNEEGVCRSEKPVMCKRCPRPLTYSTDRPNPACDSELDATLFAPSCQAFLYYCRGTLPPFALSLALFWM
jgi:hypothetical protein